MLRGQQANKQLTKQPIVDVLQDDEGRCYSDSFGELPELIERTRADDDDDPEWVDSCFALVYFTLLNC